MGNLAEKINPNLLDILLKDNTTKKNIIWATNDYKEFGYEAEQEITSEQVSVIRTRHEKIREHQKNRTRDKAEIFTPSWLCNEQNNLIDEAWFGRADVFNSIIDVKNHTWEATTEKIFFDGERSWQNYVEANRLEVACGEAPYLVSRYDTVSGDEISIENRIGLLDRKLRVISENVDELEDGLNWSKKALQSTYGYEFQGDNLFIARCNIFLTVKEFFFNKYNFNCDVYQDFLKEIAEIISWNLWQMNGLTNKIPYAPEDNNINLFDEKQEKRNIYCKIKDWQNNEEPTYKELCGERRL